MGFSSQCGGTVREAATGYKDSRLGDGTSEWTEAEYSSRQQRAVAASRTGTDREGSDLDVLVDALPATTLFDLGVSVDVLTPGDLPQKYCAQVLAQASPVCTTSAWPNPAR